MEQGTLYGARVIGYPVDRSRSVNIDTTPTGREPSPG